MYELRIVIGDPDATERAELKRLLTRAHHLILAEASDGLSLLKLVRRLSPDLVIVSWSMPTMNGVGVASILEEERLCPVIALVDYLSEPANQKAVPYVVKPVTANNLFPVVDMVMGHHQEVMRLQGEIKKLREALETRKLVEKAKGVLMKNRGWSEEQAFRHMQKLSMDRRSTFKSVAEAILLTV